MIASAMALICTRFGKPERELVDWYNPQVMLSRPDTEKLWLDLFDALQHDGTMRFDIAIALVAFFSDGKCAPPTTSLSKDEWTKKYKDLLV